MERRGIPDVIKWRKQRNYHSTYMYLQDKGDQQEKTTWTTNRKRQHGRQEMGAKLVFTHH